MDTAFRSRQLSGRLERPASAGTCRCNTSHPSDRSPSHCTDWVETAHLAACPAIAAALAVLECEIGATRLMKLGAGSQILEHRDHDLSAELGFARLHLPLSTNAQVEFRVNGIAVDMQPGQWWYLRLSDPHAVDNRGSSDRIHLVVDARVNDWLANLLREAAA